MIARVVPRPGRLIANVAIFAMYLCVLVLAYWYVTNEFTESTKFSNPRIAKVLRPAANGPEEVPPDVWKRSERHAVARPGYFIELNYEVTRFRACKLEISRLMENRDQRREYQVQYVVQSFEADKPPKPRPSGFRVQVLPEIPPGEYVLFPRVRYYCNGLDWLVPRYKVMAEVQVTVTP